MDRRILKAERRAKFRTPHKVVRIYCNGEQTERLYFESLLADLRLFMVQVIPKPHNRKSLITGVDKCLRWDGNDVDEVWVVFDVDAHADGATDVQKCKEQANTAVHMCASKGRKYIPIVSNDSFEYWFLLHYQKDFAHRHRNELEQRIAKQIGEKYEKHTPMYDRLKDKLPIAISHAKEVCDQYAQHTPIADRAPYTNVYTLVEALLSLAVSIKTL